MKRIFSLTAATLTIGSGALAMEPVQPIDLKIKLTSELTACDAQAFKTSWKSYQETTVQDEVAITRAHLTQLATQLKTQKESERTTKLNDTWARGLAGLCAVPTVALAVAVAYFNVDYYQRELGFPIINKLLKKKFKDVALEAACLLPIPYCIRYALADINYARFAGTQQLTQEIAALDTISALLAVQPEATQNQV